MGKNYSRCEHCGLRNENVKIRHDELFPQMLCKKCFAKEKYRIRKRKRISKGIAHDF